MGNFILLKLKGKNLIDKALTKAKIEYAKRMRSALKMEYVFIPSKYADMILQDFLKQSEENYERLYNNKH